MKPKKIPLRMCSGCSGRFSKKELVRVVRSPDGEISLDTTGRKSGRGAYVCPKAGCLKLARKAKRLERALECAIPDAVYDSLEKAISAEYPLRSTLCGGGGNGFRRGAAASKSGDSIKEDRGK